MPSPREVIETFYEKLARGDMAGVMALYAPDIVYTMTGTTPVSGTYHGLDEIREKLLVPIFSRLRDLVLTPDELIADGERVVALARGEAKTTSGAPYRNRYAFVFRVRGGAIAEVTEFLDTALVETALFGKTLSASAGEPHGTAQ
jgi:hypothetical protein